MEKKRKKKLLTSLILGGILLYVIFAWFLPNFIGGLSVLNKFKPTPEQEAPISDKSTLAPPVLNIPYEATSTATINIKGYSLPKATVEIYVDDSLKVTTQAKDDGSFVAEGVDLGLGSNNIFGKTIDEKGNKSLSSKPIKIIYDNEKPKLSITQPQDNQTINGDKKVTFEGSVEPKDNISVTINGALTVVGSDGRFSKTVELNDGENDITVTATTQTGNFTQISRKVIYQP